MSERDSRTGQPDAPNALDAAGWSSNLEVRHLRAFVALVDQGSLTRAARAMGVAQSTVSEALAGLERAIGTSAVGRRRGAHELTLTPAGQALLPHARRILDALANAHAAVAAAAHDALAGVEIIANESVSSYLLPAALAAMRTRWPNTRFVVSVATCAAVRSGVESSRYDVGIWLQQPSRGADISEPPSTHRVVLADVPLTVFAQPGHPLLRKAAVPASGQSRPAPGIDRNALLAYPLHISDGSGEFHDLLEQFFLADAVGRPRFEAAGTIEGVKHNVAADERAIGVLPSYTLTSELRAGTFRSLALQPAAPHVRLDAVTVASRPLHPAVEELLAELSRWHGPRVISRAI